MSGDKLKIAFLIGRDDLGTQTAIARVCALDGVEAVAVLWDTAVPSRKQRWRNLKKNLRQEGLSYLFYRALGALRAKLEACADRVIPQAEVEDLLRRAFPERDLEALGMRYGFKIFRPGNLNGPEAIQCLRSVGADLGVVMGTRVLKRGIFSVPRLGCINLHKGEVPEYRGTPPGFWEMYDGRDSAGVTIHFVDDGLDTGDVVATCSLPVHGKDTPDSLHRKLDLAGEDLLVSTIQAMQQGTADRRPQPAGGRKARTRPTRAQTMELARKLPHWRKLGDGRQAVKIAFWLAVYHSGCYRLLRWSRRGRSRGAILLYHRVNDVSDDVLTASTQKFAEHLVTLRHFYRVVPTGDLVERIAQGTSIPATSVAIHFDDCYRDVRTCAAELLGAAGLPATAFVSSGFVDTERVFHHDRDKSPHRFPNFRAQDLRELGGLGVEVAAHTVNHVDLGTISLEEAQVEVEESRRELEHLLAHPVLLFSFPFGGIRNIREEVRDMVRSSGYRALFSAHGGFIDEETKIWDIPRLGASSDHSALALMMELEGISPLQFRYWLSKRFGRRTA
jgi:peptidoglycan/xylan/chitin deacetylase (PgdA/CDA1 family)